MTRNRTALLDSHFEIQRAIRELPARQQPGWRDLPARDAAVMMLARSSPIVTEDEILELNTELRTVAGGRALLIQAGDCAEPITDTEARIVAQKARALDTMSRVLESRGDIPVVRIGRIAGQFAKPRSRAGEKVGESILPTYRGALVNDSHPSQRAREHDPQRLIRAHTAAEEIARHLRGRTGERIWTSHEALVLDYELPQLRPTSDGRMMLTSAHTVWIGARTGQVDHAHVALASSIINPIGFKVSPGTTPDELATVAAAIDPDRESGRLMLIARMGSSVHTLPVLMEAVKREGHPAIWLSDPMHANTVATPDGRKVRYTGDIATELRAFQEAARTAGVIAAGVHLETTIDDVTECLEHADDDHQDHTRHTTLCDPRLTTEQAVHLLSYWRIGVRW